jgi:hypothetical protein
MSSYYLHDGNNESGAFSIEELRQKNIKPENYVWTEGFSEWRRAKDVDELKELFIAIPPPFAKQIAPQILNSPVQNNKSSLSPLAIIGIVAGSICVLFFVIFAVLKGQVKEVAAAQRQTADQVQQINNDQSNAEAEKKKRVDAITQRNMSIRNNWATNFASEENGSYTIGNFGGISNFSVKVTNNTDFLLDEYVIKVSYYLKSGSLYESHVLSITNLPAHAYQVINAPASSRGTHAEYEVTSVRCSKIHFLYTPNYTSGNPNDPYVN